MFFYYLKKNRFCISHEYISLNIRYHISNNVSEESRVWTSHSTHVSNEMKFWTDLLVSQKSTSIERRAIKRKRPRKLIIVGIVVPYHGNRESKPDDLFQTGQTSSISFRRPKSSTDEDLVDKEKKRTTYLRAL